MKIVPYFWRLLHGRRPAPRQVPVLKPAPRQVPHELHDPVPNRKSEYARRAQHDAWRRRN